MKRIVSVDNGLQTEDGEDFRIMGVNYIKLDRNSKGHLKNVLFSPKVFDEHLPRIKWAMKQLQRDEYNTVRILLTFWDYDDSTGNPEGFRGLNTEYFVRVAQFIKLARSYGLYVIVTLDNFPQNNYYRLIESSENPTSWDEEPESVNKWIMSPGGIAAKTIYLTNAIKKLQAELEPEDLPTILAYSIDNEMHFRADRFPFNKAGQGQVNYQWFDMDSPKDRQCCADLAAANYIRACVTAIRKADADVIISTGAYTFDQLGFDSPDGLVMDDSKQAKRPVRLSAIIDHLGLFGMHIYPNEKSDEGHEAAAVERGFNSMVERPSQTPIFIEETGAYRFIYGTPVDAAKGMSRLLKSLVLYDVCGWMLWPFDEEIDNLHDVNDQNGALNYLICPRINGDLSSINRKVK